jgi:protoporphyrinogen oxidase
MKKSVAIFGAGITGLAAGRELVRRGYSVDVYEADDHIGGLASTFKDSDGFIYDNGPRFIFSTLAEKLGIQDICEPVKYFEHLYVGQRYYLFPFGFVRNPRYSLSVLSAMVSRIFRSRPTNLGNFLQTYYGQTFSREVLAPLIQKWSGLPTEEMSIDFASRLLPTNLSYILHSVVKRLRGGITKDYYKGGRYIVYPKGSNLKIFEALASTPGLRVHCIAELKRLETNGSVVLRALVGERTISADYFVSTIPISKVVDLLDNPRETSPWVRFRYRGVAILFVKVNRPRVLDSLWTWFPEPKYRFYRVSELKNALKDTAPPDRTMLAVEIACNVDDPFFALNAEQVFLSIKDDLNQLYALRPDEILGLDLRKSPAAYPVLRKATEEEQRNLRHQTPFKNLFIAGRTGMFQYRMLEGCFDSAISCVDALVASVENRPVHAPLDASRDTYGRPLRAPD